MNAEQIAALKTQLLDWGIPMAGKALAVLFALFVASRIAAWVARMVEGGMGRAKVDETLTRFTARMIRYLILAAAVIGCLGAFGIETTSFAALIGAAGLAIGLAFQDTLSNFSAGVMLLVFRPFKVGDVVNLAGTSGKVHEIELFTTAVDTFDKRRLIIPNSKIFGSTIENVTYHPVRRVDVTVGVEYASDIDETREVLTRAVRSVDHVEKDPEPAVVLTGLGSSSIDWVVRAWAHNDHFWPVKEALIRAVKMHLDEAGIGIPFPNVEVHLVEPEQIRVRTEAAG